MREITTPNLPGFITSCLNIVKARNIPSGSGLLEFETPLLPSILEAFIDLIYLHPTSFRPFLSQLQILLLPLLAPTPSCAEASDRHVLSSKLLSSGAQRLFVLFSLCAPKNTAAEEWDKSLRDVILSIHATTDRVFRALLEDATSVTQKPTAQHGQQSSLGDEVADLDPKPLSLPAWTGISAGIERLNGLLQILQGFIATATPTVVIIPVDTVINAIDRILSGLPPTTERPVRTRSEIERDERDGLFVGLPLLHVSAIQVSSLLLTRLRGNLVSISHTLLEQVLWVFEGENFNTDIRITAYTFLTQMLMLFGPSLPKNFSTPLLLCVKRCCEDLLPPISRQDSTDASIIASKKNGSKSAKGPTNTDSFLNSKSTSSGVSRPASKVRESGARLLPLILTHLPTGFFPISIRREIDRTAILVEQRDILLASVMNPPMQQNALDTTSSVLPLLVRSHPEASAVEALVRPQMPVIQQQRNENLDSLEEESEARLLNDPGQRDFGPVATNLHSDKFEIGLLESELDSHDDPLPSVAGTKLFGNHGADSALSEPAQSHTAIALGSDSSTEVATHKHPREDNPELSANVVTYPTGIETHSKRRRMSSDQGAEDTIQADLTNTCETLTKEHPETQQRQEVMNAPSVAAPGTRMQIETDSDESDFVMPTLNIGSEPDDDEESQGDAEH